MLEHRNSSVSGPLLILIACLAAIAAAKYAQDLLAPVVLALVLGVVLSPIAKRAEAIGAPRALIAALLLGLAWATLFFLIAMLGPVLTAVWNELPAIELKFRGWLNELTYALRAFGGVEVDLERSFSENGEEAVEGALPGLTDALWFAPNLLAQMLIFSGTLFFFLLTRDQVYCAFPTYRKALQSADRSLSHYFVTIALINAGLGMALFIVLTILGVPHAALWGGAAFFANFVLYLGPLAIMAALALSGVINFDSAYALLPPLSFLMLNALESQFVTPSLVGKRMNINPLVVFLSIVFGLWLWGPLGGMVSLPLVIWTYSFTAAQNKRGTVSDYAAERAA